MKSYFTSLLLSTPLLISAATVDDLLITEVVPSTGQVEVTNLATDALTVSSSLPFCHRFRYSDAIPGGTVFEAGESLVFNLNFSNAADTDLWLYRGGSFGDASNIISGLKWGPATEVGRTGIATAAGLWDGVGIATPPNGMAIKLIASDETSSTSWEVGAPDLGNFELPGSFGSGFTLVVESGDDGLDLRWQGGIAPFRVESSTDLKNWDRISGVLNSRTFSVEPAPEDNQRFYRVQDQVVVEQAAQYRITFSTLWTADRFQSVPGSAHFSGLVGATHNDSVSFWNPGATASPGIRSMAETGSKSALLGEISTASSSGLADTTLSGGGLGFAPSTTTVNFTANRSHPLLTITSMIAPSPDWFVGLHGHSLLTANGDWLPTQTIDLVAYDAGTDSGTAFTSRNNRTSPAVPIFVIPASDPNFAPATGPVGDPIPIARVLIERVN